MKRRTESSGNFVGIMLGLILLLSGLAIAIVTFVTIIGPIIGVLMMLMGLAMGGKRVKVWRCRRCKHVQPC